MSSTAYPISSPVEFVNETAGDALIFNADGPSTSSKNQIVDFVTTSPGDLIYRDSSGTSNKLERLPIGSTGHVLTVSGMAAAQVQNISTVADVADSLDGTYFLLSSPSTSYYFWFSTSGGSATDPGLAFPAPTDLISGGTLKTGVQINIPTGAPDGLVAGALVISILSTSEFVAVTIGPNVLEVTNNVAGACDAAADGLAATGFTIPLPSTPGSSAAPTWAAPIPGSASDTFLVEATSATASAIAPGSTWVTVDSSVVTWDDSTLPNHDAGGNFNPATGVFTVPATGIYTLSANVTFEANNSGNGGGGISGRRAIRQARVRNTTSGASMAFGENQARPSNRDPTQINLVVAAISVTAADELVIQVRHDASVSLAISVDEDGTPTQGPTTYFSATRMA